MARPRRLSSSASQRPCCVSVAVGIHPGARCHAPLSPLTCGRLPEALPRPAPLGMADGGHSAEQGGSASGQGTAQVDRALHKRCFPGQALG